MIRRRRRSSSFFSRRRRKTPWLPAIGPIGGGQIFDPILA